MLDEVLLESSESTPCVRASTAGSRNERRVRSMAGSRTVVVGEWGRRTLAGKRRRRSCPPGNGMGDYAVFLTKVARSRPAQSCARQPKVEPKGSPSKNEVGLLWAGSLTHECSN